MSSREEMVHEIEESRAELAEAIRRTWGYDSLRPLQRQAMEAILTGRDSVVVLPTGGGKSLCYQAPALLKPGLMVVISPLISLMKDQVDGLTSNGVAAAALNSSMSPDEQRQVEAGTRSGRIQILFLSPERLTLSSTLRLLEDAGVSSFAIDEAHCISHWGHDFRPEYRQVRHLRKRFPRASFHAFTATATTAVREDIALQLDLRDPLVLVGSFDRPNLTYRVVQRENELRQVEEIVARHPGEAGIVYCIRRRDVDSLSAALRQRGRNVVSYHAGMSAEERRTAQDAFSREECDLVVATVAFGMGIDRSNVRYVLHTGLPKSIEHYQQETGRAGRDGLAAECILLYSPSDAMTWRSILEKSSGEEASPDYLASAFRQVGEMQRYATGVACRHRSLVEYFGQSYEGDSCGACDVCLGGYDELSDSLITSQKILSCVARTGGSFGAAHVISVLRGENLARIRERGHDRLSTFGIMREFSKAELRDLIDQLISLDALQSSGDAFPVIRLGSAARAILRSETNVTLRQRVNSLASSKRDETEWQGIDRELFEALRAWRKNEADSRQVAPFVVFGDRTLRSIATVRPSSLERLANIYGIGQAKLAEYGQQLLVIVQEHAANGGRELDRRDDTPSVHAVKRPSARSSATRDFAFAAFDRDASIDEVMEETQRAHSTIVGYLTDYITDRRPSSIERWVDSELYERVAAATERLGTALMRPVYEHLGGDVSYDVIRLVTTHLAVIREPDTAVSG